MFEKILSIFGGAISNHEISKEDKRNAQVYIAHDFEGRGIEPCTDLKYEQKGAE